MVARVTSPTPNRPVVEEDGSMTLEMRAWTQIITDQALIIATGSPEGVIEALQGAKYMDDAGTVGNIEYIKRDADVAGDKTLGWILI